MTDWLIPLSVAIAVAASHIIKETIHVIRKGSFSWYTLLMETGGMPSSHSAAVTALTTSIFVLQGPSALFWASLVFAAVVIRDAFGVRRSVSDQAQIINTLLSKADMEKKVNIILGHTPLQAVIGVLVGFAAAMIGWAIL